jgi:hypothetical protein
MTNEMIERLKRLAARECFFDDDEDKIVADYAGRDVEYAYGLGETLLARDILNSMGVEW